MLSVQIYLGSSKLLECRERDHPVVVAGLRPTGRGYDPRDDRVGIADYEPTFDDGLSSLKTNECRVAFASDEQLQGLYDQRLSCPSLSGDDAETGAERDVDVVDHAERSNPKLFDHRDLTVRKTKFGPKHPVEVRGVEGDETSRTLPPMNPDRVTRLQRNRGPSVDDQHRRSIGQ